MSIAELRDVKYLFSNGSISYTYTSIWLRQNVVIKMLKPSAGRGGGGFIYPTSPPPLTPDVSNGQRVAKGFFLHEGAELHEGLVSALRSGLASRMAFWLKRSSTASASLPRSRAASSKKAFICW